MGAIFLLVCLVYLLVAIALVVKAKGWKAKTLWATGLALLPTFDVITAQAYMHYRCSQDGGIRVYETVRLEESDLIAVKTIYPYGKKDRTYYQDPNWDIQRQLKCVQENPETTGALKCKQLPKRYQIESNQEELAFGVRRYIDRYSDKVSNKLLAELIVYDHKNNWFIRIFFGEQGWSGWHCPQVIIPPSEFKKKLFDISNP